MSGLLSAVGWNDRLAAAFSELYDEGLTPGRIVLEHTHIYRIVTAGGELLARASGRLRHRASSRSDFPVVGDWVAVEVSPGAVARIHAVLPRWSRFSRRAAGNPTEEQVVAANIDTVFLVAGLDGDFNPRRIERYLVVALESGASPVIVLNKSDLVTHPETHAADVRTAAPGVPIHVVSCRTPETLDLLRPYLGAGQTGALLGSSGVGKSTIVNRLLGRELLRTRDVRQSDSRGRHATTARQLVQILGAGVLIDTPGLREIQLWDVGTPVEAAFADIEALAAGCRFRDCRHRQEPGCAVITAVDAGEFSSGRLHSFHKLQDEQAYQARQQDERAQIDEKRKGRIGAKALRKRLREKDR